VTAAPSDNFEICLSTLRETDRDRYLACLLSPAEKRGALAALYAFHAEIARVRDVIQQPLAGEIRLQWWRDLLDGKAQGEASANPVAGETASALVQLAGLVLDAPSAMASSEIAGHAGVAQAIAGLLMLMPLHCRRGQLYLPQDILSATGLDRDRFLSGEPNENIGHAIEALAGLGLDHLEKARKANPIPAPVLAAFLPVAMAEPVLRRAARLKAGVLTADLQPAQWRRQLRMARTLVLKTI
jgi:15-cis-phytoene synthase